MSVIPSLLMSDRLQKGEAEEPGTVGVGLGNPEGDVDGLGTGVGLGDSAGVGVGSPLAAFLRSSKLPFIIAYKNRGRATARPRTTPTERRVLVCLGSVLKFCMIPT